MKKRSTSGNTSHKTLAPTKIRSLTFFLMAAQILILNISKDVATSQTTAPAEVQRQATAQSGTDPECKPTPSLTLQASLASAGSEGRWGAVLVTCLTGKRETDTSVIQLLKQWPLEEL